MTEPHTRLDYRASIDHPRLSLPDGGKVAVPAAYPRVTQAAHPYSSGVPHRIGWFEKALAHMAAQSGTRFWQGRQIMDWYNKEATR